MNHKPWVSFLGLANRARKVISGEELVVKEIQRKRAKLVILSEDASENTRKKISDKCSFYRVPLCYVDSRHELGGAIGKGARVVVAITDEGFAQKLKTML
ncbi:MULTISPECIES: YlxQ family RNA-binding protein [Anoxybacillus]|uniref:Ribosomal protein L7Ae-like RNA K-turn-binding protein n=1 Tax=Anoxybacillus mongoliensis TaxID=452565 RepID=A0A7W8JFN5_9BACL|nr:YlxQ family RNA-binding protein [Anoxybacillus mongoliensis]MBB5354843.1 ribosomal protein L7Ae-like RNA K-turn-binding protein [Anoxybacillus mongoliensis]MCX8002167.1 YlxQ family RNA-binding protein [Anoxybacillus mongoliensis]